MKRRGALAALCGATLLRLAHAEAPFPTRPITLVVPFASGGIADLTARTVTKAMAASLGQAIIIDNRPSAGSVVGSGMVAHAAPDGYTLLLLSNANAISVSLFRTLPYDTTKDFAPISTLATFDLGVFVPAESRLRTLSDAIAQARATPGRLTICCITVGSTQHLAAELFRSKAGIDMLIVPYKGTPAVLTALRAGEIDLAFEILGPMLPQARTSLFIPTGETTTGSPHAMELSILKLHLPAHHGSSASGIRPIDISRMQSASISGRHRTKSTRLAGSVVNVGGRSARMRRRTAGRSSSTRASASSIS